MPLWKSYAATFLLFGAMDAAWLSFAVKRLYRPQLGDMLAAQPRPGPAIAFYVLYVAGIVWFAVRPGLAGGPAVAALNGALLGGLCYVTYDLTNQATLARWSWAVALADIAWGTFATGVASAAAVWAVRRFG